MGRKMVACHGVHTVQTRFRPHSRVHEYIVYYKHSYHKPRGLPIKQAVSRICHKYCLQNGLQYGYSN